MDRITRARNFLIGAFAVVTMVFVAVITPWKGLGIITFPILVTGIVLWITGAVLLFAGLANLNDETYQKWDLIIALLVFLLFVPVGYQYMKISGEIRTRITVHIDNQSDVVIQNIEVYGTGDLFAGRDTLRVDQMVKGQQIEFVIQPDTKPQKGGGKKGSIEMAYDLGPEHTVRVLAGEFSIYPQNIQQEVEVVIDKAFLGQQ